MELPNLLPFAVHVYGYDAPSDVIDAMALGEFVAGRQPCSVTVRLQRIRPEARLLPPEVEPVRRVVVSGSRSHLAVGPSWTLLAFIGKDRTGYVRVTATAEELARQVISQATDGAVEPAPSPDEATTMGFWRMAGRGGAHLVDRSIEAAPWPPIRRNYASSVAAAVDQLLDLDGGRLPGRLLLLHGPPGTGKTTLLRALAHGWRSWCRFEYVIDPEKLLENSAYLMQAVLGDRDDEGEPDKRWRMLVLEDCDELIRADAKRAAGQAVSRLLNLTDGLVGQGLDLLVCVTTNEDLHRLHPAIVRPGRCLAHVHVGRLPPAEAATWLGNGHHVGPDGATLAELYALRGDLDPVEKPEELRPLGQYL